MVVVSGFILILIGLCFALLGSIGMIRLPDFYTRAHAATKPDTLGLLLTMFGLVLLYIEDQQTFIDPTIVKLVLITIFVAITNPASAHALGRVAYKAGLPMLNTFNKNEQSGEAKGGNHE